MAPTDSGSDGENGEKPVRERLKHTTIAKTAADGEVADSDPGGSEMEVQESMEADKAVASSKDGIRKKPGKKRSLEDLSATDAVQDLTEGVPATPSSGGHLRKRYREIQDDNDQIQTAKSDDADEARTADARDESTDMHTPPPDSTSDTSNKMLSPTRKRSREHLESEDREQKIQATDETRARRSSEEERPEPSTIDSLSKAGASREDGEDGATRSTENSESTQRSTKIPSSSGFANSSAVSPFGTLASSNPSLSKDSPSDSSKTTAKSAFASSGFASMVGATSAFGAIGGVSPTSPSQGSQSPQPSTFTSIASTLKAGSGSSTSTLTFGSNTTTSTFGSFGGSVFGSGFSGGTGAPRLTSFAAPVGDTNFEKKETIKPIGSPSNTGDGSDNDEDEDDDAVEGEDGEEQDGSRSRSRQPKSEEPETKFEVQENLDTGEEDENTIYSQNAKLFQWDKPSGQWKERGLGAIKVNVPKADSTNNQTKTDSDAKQEGDEKKKEKPKRVPRLLMRTTATHKLILNTPVFKEMNAVQDGKTMRFNAPGQDAVIGPHLLRVGKEPDMKNLLKTVNDILDKF